jgi:uncharacterized protein (DUF924 family)
MDSPQVLAFWFGTLDAQGLADVAHMERWWRKDPEFDAEIRKLFRADWDELMRAPSAPPADARELLAQVIVLDQFSRNMFRGDPRSFSADAQALALARGAVATGADQALQGHLRVFLYMPFMHSEQLADQDECLRLFAAFRDQVHDGRFRADLEYNLRFAQQHRDIIARFGRFPHRNELLGRSSTPEELEFLKQPGSSF